jgi:glycosyltransferase involved in cell wall biosynthesis
MHSKRPGDHTPVISIIITAYNYGRFLGKAMESVLSQNFTDFELLVLNNASTDNTDEVAKRYVSDSRVRYTLNETNIGGPANASKGLKNARAPYILFLSADDFLLPGALSILHRTLGENKDVDFIYGRYLFVDGSDAVIQEVKHPGWLPYDHKGRSHELADLLQFDCYISMPTVLFKRTVFDQNGHFSTEVRVGDYEFFLRLAALGYRSFFINTPLAAFRLHGNQMSVGGDVISSGSQVSDQLTLLEMYFTAELYPKLAGCETGILNLLASKIEAFNRCLDRNTGLAPAIQRRAREIVARVNQLRAARPDIPPLVSVIVPTKNRPEMLGNALTSILNQTFPDFEIIVINDGGEDVGPLIDSLNKRNNIRHIRHETPRDRSAARNSGLKAARGKYIAYLDDDDRYYPDHLRILVNFLESRGAHVAYTDSYRALEEVENGAYVVKQRQLLYSYDFNPEMIFVENLFPNLCLMHARSCIEDVGMFDETLGTHEDWDLWIRLSLKFRFHHIRAVTSEYSFRNDKTNTTTRNNADFLRTREILYKRYHRYVESKPHLLRAQEKSLAMQRASSAGAGSVADFMQTVTAFVEQSKLTQALSFYDAHRAAYISLPELEQFDSLIGIVRKTVASKG